jgi:ketosteroid isomerase-like protein
MSQKNVDLFLEGADAISRGDVETVLDGASEDVVWIAARSAVEGAYHGHEGRRRFLADNAESFELFQPAFDEVRDLGDRVLAFGTFRIRARGSGVETDFPVAASPPTARESSSGGRTLASATWPSMPPGCGSRRGDFR